jgi:hypothetical protein
VRPDYLEKVVTGYTAKLFDSKLFTESLSKELKPNRFDLIPTPSSVDFSVEIVTKQLESIQVLSEKFEFPPNFLTVSWEEVLETQMENSYRPKLEYLYDDPLDADGESDQEWIAEVAFSLRNTQ